MTVGQTGFADDKAVSRQGQWRTARPLGGMIDHLSGPATGVVLFTGLALMLMIPLLALPAGLALGWYLIWISRGHYRLPMRVPKSWPGLDYSDNIPGSDSRFKRADGLLFLGNDDTGRELWITNSDARRHIFVIGTTGSGKTEYLLGNIVQPLAWGSGCLFIDGKGTPEFYARIWSLAKRFGREDDVRVINFTGVSGEGEQDADAPAGSLGSQSNTLNPFAVGSADQLIQMISSLMSSGSGGTGDMWKERAVRLMASLVRSLVEMRDRGEIFMDVQTIRDFMPLGYGVPGGAKPLDGNRKDLLVDDITDGQWDAIRKGRSMSSLYLRSLKGDFNSATTLALAGFFDSLPGFNLQALLKGEPQSNTTEEQFGYLSMQLTQPLGILADDYAHIFRTTLAEVNMEDIVYRRRILVVLLPALQKAPAETRNLGKIVVAMVKSMMGSASGSTISGTRKEIIESSPTRSSSPFLAVFDEAGYYLVQGMDVMAAQARSLGFSIIIGAQDIQAMRGEQRQVADSVIANTFLTAVGATVDANDSLEFIKRKVGTQKVLQTTGMERVEGLAGTGYREGGLTFSDVERLQVDELRNLAEGQFHFVYRDNVIKGRSFYVGQDFHPEFRKNFLVPLRGPLDNRTVQAMGEENTVQSDESFYVEELNKIFGLFQDEDLPAHDADQLPLTTSLLAIMDTTQELQPIDGGPSPHFTTMLEIILAQAEEQSNSENEWASDVQDSDFELHEEGDLNDNQPEGELYGDFQHMIDAIGIRNREEDQSVDLPDEPDQPKTITTNPFLSPDLPDQPAADAGPDPEPGPGNDSAVLEDSDPVTPDQLVSALSQNPESTSGKTDHDSASK